MFNGENGENGEGKSRRSRKTVIYSVVAAVLAIGLLLGSVAAGLGPLAAWVGNDDNGEVADPADGEMSFEEMKPQLKEYLAQQKENDLIMEHLLELREEMDVEKNLETVVDTDEEDIDKDAAVASVNGEEISAEQYLNSFNQQKQQYMMQGVDLGSEEMAGELQQLQQKILNRLIDFKLLDFKAEEEGISATEEEVEQEFQYYAQQFGGEEILVEQFKEQGLSREEVDQEIASEIARHKYLDAYVDEHLDVDNLEFSEDELRELYDEFMMQMQMQQQMQQQMEDFEDVPEDLDDEDLDDMDEDLEPQG